MIPKGGSKFPEFFPKDRLVKGTEVTILTEPAPKDNEKLKAPFYCEVEYKGDKYTLSFNWTTYYTISANDTFGKDTSEWVGLKIKYGGLQPIKGKMGTVHGHVWLPSEAEIDLNKQEAPF